MLGSCGLDDDRKAFSNAKSHYCHHHLFKKIKTSKNIKYNTM